MREIAKGTNCTLRIRVSEVGKVQDAKKIDTHITSASGVVSCIDNAYDELEREVVVSIDGALLNEVGAYSVDMRIVYAEETVVVPTITFAEVVEDEGSECEEYAVIDIDVKGGSVTPSESAVVELVDRKEFDALSKKVSDKVDKVEGKGLSTNDFTDEYKQKVQTIPNKVDTTTFEEALQALDQSYGEVHEQLYKEIEGKANKSEIIAKDGYYPSLSVGMADNLVGRGDVQDAQINFRPSAGEANITDHAARIERIKGNSVVWNQLVNTDSTSVELVAKRTYFTDIDGEQSVRIISATTTIEAQFGRDKVVDLTQMFGVGNEPTTVEKFNQRKPMNIADEYADNAGTLVDMHVDTLVSTGDNAYDKAKGFARVMGGVRYDISDSDGTQGLEVYLYPDREDIEEVQIEVQTDGQQQYCIFPYTGQCVVDGGNGDYGVCLNHSYHKAIKPFEQDTKYFSWIWDIMYNEGKELFPEGVRSAGSSCDEIRYNRTTKKWEAVKRIGVATNLTFISGGTNLFAVSIADSKWPEIPKDRPKAIFSNKYAVSKNVATSSMDDKSMLQLAQKNNIYIKDTTYSTVVEFNEANKDLVIYYELAEPIVVELDYPTAETNMDYMAWDFGTEEAIVPNNAPSAPFRADINYEPNAVDDLRWAVSEIRSLKAQLEQMQTNVTNLTE